MSFHFLASLQPVEVTILASFMLYICAVILVRAYGKNGCLDELGKFMKTQPLPVFAVLIIPSVVDNALVHSFMAFAVIFFVYLFQVATRKA